MGLLSETRGQRGNMGGFLTFHRMSISDNRKINIYFVNFT